MRRPLSPHLQIYRLQLTSVLSVLHRITGLKLWGCFVLTFIYIFIALIAPDKFSWLQSYLHGWPIQTFLSFYSVFFIYHMLNGIRHIFWDMRIGLELSKVYLSGKVVIILTFILGIFAIFYMFDVHFGDILR